MRRSVHPPDVTEINREARRELFDAAVECLRTERRRVVDEREAFAAFERRMRELDGCGGSVRETTPGVQLATTGPQRGLEAVKNAYDATVMSVPHYDEEYDEPFSQHVRGEFGPELAALLTRRGTFDSRARQAVLAAASEAQESRSRLIEAVDAERESFEELAGELLSLLAELPEYEEAAFPERRFGTLDAYRARLLVLEEQCRDAVDRRQGALVEQRRSLSLPIEGPDVPTYLYRDLETTYPLVATAADTLDHVESLRRDVERALSYSH